MKICIVCYGFREHNIRLQPWRYISEIAKGLLSKKIDVTLITDGPTERHLIDSIPVNHLENLRKFPFKKNKELITLIKSEKPDIILWSISPIDYLYMNTFKHINIPIIGMFTGPIYKLSDITRIGIQEIIQNLNFLSVHIMYASMPSFFIRNLANAPYFNKIFVMSRKNKEILENLGVQKDKVVHIPAGIDEYDLIKPADCHSIANKYKLDNNSFNFLYFGSPITIRGIDSLIKAVSKAKNDYPNIKLIILSRRRGNELSREELFVQSLIKKLDIEKNIQIISGFLDKEDVKKFISYSDAIALPFKIVPSDVPTSILESMAMGKTVISTDIDGIPELLEDGRGLAIEPNNDRDLIKKLIYCVENQYSIKNMGEKSELYMADYPKWNDVSKSVIDAIKEITNQESINEEIA